MNANTSADVTSTGCTSIVAKKIRRSDPVAITVFGRHLPRRTRDSEPRHHLWSAPPTRTQQQTLQCSPISQHHLLHEKEREPHRSPEYLQIWRIDERHLWDTNSAGC